MKRQLIVNWSDAHTNLKKAIEEKVASPLDVLDTGKGWSYVTFLKPGTLAEDILYDVSQLEQTARDNGFFLPAEVVRQHNKVVVSTLGEGLGGSAQLFHLHAFLTAYAQRFADPKRHPNHWFYGKFGGMYDRTAKGRVLAMYSRDDDALLEIHESVEALARELDSVGMHFSVRLSNGLSAIPRMLHGFDDPEYRRSGATMYRITDPTRFEHLLDQARQDYSRYLFTQKA